MDTEILYSARYYDVRKLEESIPVENNGAVLYFNYALYNSMTDRVEGYAQFLPAGIEQVKLLDKHLSSYLTPMKEVEKEDSDGNVVEFSA